MPQLGETVTEGTVTRWLKAVGDEVETDEPLLEVSTDKVDTEIPSAAAGLLHEILVPEGETVPVGTPLARIGDPADRSEDESAGPEPAGPDVGAAPSAPVVPPGPGTPARRADARSEAGGTFLSPVVRRLVGEHGLDPSGIRATGAGGRITAADVRDHVRTHRVRPELRSDSRPDPQDSAPPLAGSLPTADDEVIPFSSLRRRTAAHMMRSLASSAHTLVVVEVDYHRVAAVRAEHKDAFAEREGVGLSYMPFVIRAVVDAIAEYPQVNASVGDDELHVHRRINVGVAVDLDHEGLIVPVVHDAQQLRLAALARRVTEQAGKARTGSLAPDDVADGTITITNAGGYGTLLTAPIIAQPQVAIVSTDGVAMRPAAVQQPDGAWSLAVHPLGNLALSFDHRAFDGAYASAFLDRVRAILQDRDWATEVGP